MNNTAICLVDVNNHYYYNKIPINKELRIRVSNYSKTETYQIVSTQFPASCKKVTGIERKSSELDIKKVIDPRSAGETLYSFFCDLPEGELQRNETLEITIADLSGKQHAIKYPLNISRIFKCEFCKEE